jgi:hypothetical protein
LFRKRRFWLGTIISLLFLALFFYQIDFEKMGEVMLEADYLYLLPALIIYFAGVWFRALRWQFLLSPLRTLSSKRLFSVVVIGYMANNLLPLRAGELVRAYILGEREEMSKAAVLATIAIERIFDGLSLLFIAASVSLFLPLADWLRDAVQLMALLFLGALVFLFVLATSQRLALGVTRFGLRFLPRKFADRGENLASVFLDGLRALHKPVTLAGVFITSLISWLCEAAMYYLIALSFGITQPYTVILLVTSAANLAISLPSSQGGIGPFEYFASRTLIIFGVDLAKATAYALVLHAALLLPVIALGLVFLWLENLSLAQVSQQVPQGPMAFQGPNGLEGKVEK